MIGVIKLRNGLSKDRPAYAHLGEPLFDVDTKKLWVGMGPDEPPVVVAEIVRGPNDGLYVETPKGYVPLCLK